jgi:hypothetical protein
MSAQSRPFTNTVDHDRTSSGDWKTPTSAPAGADATVGTLLRQLMHEVPTLLSSELALAKSEARESLRSTRDGLMAVSAGGIVLLGGFIVLLLSAVYALSLVMVPWLAALIVGAIATLIGFAMVGAGKRKFAPEDLKPDHTIRSVRKDADLIRGRTP